MFHQCHMSPSGVCHSFSHLHIYIFLLLIQLWERCYSIRLKTILGIRTYSEWNPQIVILSFLFLLVSYLFACYSEDNLVKDDFLRSKMDDQGWVSISLIASFPRVSKFLLHIVIILFEQVIITELPQKKLFDALTISLGSLLFIGFLCRKLYWHLIEWYFLVVIISHNNRLEWIILSQNKCLSLIFH